MQIVTVYLKSGQSVKIRCQEATFSCSNVTGEYVGYTIKGANKRFGFNPKEIAAWQAKEALF